MDGNFPDWNETLEFALHAEDGKGFTEDELINSNAALYFSLFDRAMSHRKIPYTNKYETVVENKFIGSFYVSLISVLQNTPKMDGLIKVNRPLQLQGYRVLTRDMYELSRSNVESVEFEEESNMVPTFVDLQITTEPALELPAENEYEYYGGYEELNLLLEGTKFVQDCKKSPGLAKRMIKVFGENIQGQSVFLCRYLRAQSLPPELALYFDGSGDQADVNYAIQSAARFVSLIPFLDDNAAFDNLPDIWCTSQEFLDLGYGDYEEHSILLCNYFNYIDQNLNEGRIKSYILLGKAVPEGNTTYVLRRNTENNHVEIWNATQGEAIFIGKDPDKRKTCFITCSTGYRYQYTTDTTCQLKDVGCIIGEDNIWVNKQKHGSPHLLNYKLEDKKLWRPFLTKKNRLNLLEDDTVDTVQEEPMTYIEDRRENTTHLADDIRMFISQKFADERVNHYTRWNHSCNETFTQYFMDFERYKRETCRPFQVSY